MIEPNQLNVLHIESIFRTNTLYLIIYVCVTSVQYLLFF